MDTLQPLELGDAEGHPFRGNQWTKIDPRLPKDEDPIKPGIQVTGFHTTSKEAARAIREHGFDPMAERNLGAVFGKGIYASLDTPAGRETQLNLSYTDDHRTIELTATYNNPVLVSSSDTLEELVYKMGSTRSELLRAEENYGDVGFQSKAYAVRDIAVKNGFDAIVVRGDHVDTSDSLSWDQVVVFDAAQVEVNKIAQNPVTLFENPPRQNLPEMGIDYARSFRASGEEERNVVLMSLPAFLAQLPEGEVTAAGDLPGHDFHGNQWTKVVVSRETAYTNRPENTVRVFRGEGGDGGMRPGEEAHVGKWWTPSYDYATGYGDVVSRDLTRAEYESFTPRPGLRSSTFDELLDTQKVKGAGIIGGYSPTAELIAPDDFDEKSHVHVTAAGDLEGHAFHGNQWTKTDGREGQRVSKFTSPMGEPMSRSQIGDTMEALAINHPAISAALAARFGGGPITSGHPGTRIGPWDLQANHTTAIELKSVHAESTSQKATLKRSEIEDKTSEIAAAGLKAATAVLVWEPKADGGATAHLHATDGIVSGTIKKFEELGKFDVTHDEFLNAFTAAGYGAATAAGDVEGHPFHGNQWTYHYEVEYAEDHEAMAKAEYKTTFVKVKADDEDEANLIAAQMAGRHGIPTKTKLIGAEFGESAGHPFRGNQWTKGESGEEEKRRELEEVREELRKPRMGSDAIDDPGIVMGLTASQEDTMNYLREAGAQEWKAGPLPEGTEHGTPKECYSNATSLVMANQQFGDKTLRYAEGIAYDPRVSSPGEGSIAFLHGWAVTPDGTVIDNTLPEPENVRYYGVAYDWPDYRNHIMSTEYYGVLGGDPDDVADVIENGGI